MVRHVIVICALCAAALAPCTAAEQAVTVLYFDNTTRGADYAWLSKGLADMLITDLASTGKVTVIEREEIQKVLAEQERALSEAFDEQSAVKIGKLLSASRIVAGSYIAAQNSLRVDAKLLDVETGRVLKAVQSSGTIDSLFTVEKSLAAKLLSEMGVAVPASLASETQSVQAAKAFYTGMDLMDTGDYQKAAARFKEAAVLDPFYLKPQKSLEDAYRFLKDFKNQRYQREITELYKKAAQLKARLSSTTWVTYADLLTQSYAKGMSAQDVKKITDADPTYFICETPAQCTWNLQNTLTEIGDKAVEYFQDTETEIRMHNENLAIAKDARTRFKDDPFLPEIL
jgi:TolB-like protein